MFTPWFVLPLGAVITVALLLVLQPKPVFLHDNSVATLDTLFDPVRGPAAPHPFYVPGTEDRDDLKAFHESLDTDQHTSCPLIARLRAKSRGISFPRLMVAQDILINQQGVIDVKQHRWRKDARQRTALNEEQKTFLCIPGLNPGRHTRHGG